MGVKPEMAGRHTQRVRRVIAEVIPILSLLVIFLLLAALSASILPTNKLLVLIIVVAAAVAALLWRWFIRVHTRMQGGSARNPWTTTRSRPGIDHAGQGLAQLSSQTSRAQCHTDSQVSSASSSSSANHNTTVPSSSTR